MRILLIVLTILFLSCNSSNKKQNIAEVTISETKRKSDEKLQDPVLNKSIIRGKEVYTNFCVSCHLPNGKGVSKVFPPLAQSDYLMNKRAASIRAIKYGQSGKIIVNGETYNNAMASLGLEDDEIADVMNYITNSWGNSNKKLITESEVSKIEP